MIENQDKHKRKVFDMVFNKNMTSLMNNTKWRELKTAVVNELPFHPPYQIKYVLDESPYPETFEEDVWYLGDWEEGLCQFYSIEWIKVRPRYQKTTYKLLPPETVDITEQFIAILDRLRIAYVVIDGAIVIYGYIRNQEKIEIKSK